MQRQIPEDTRGIVDPAAMMRRVDFGREAPGPELEGLIEWFWSVAWDMPVGECHDQQVLNHPAGNVSIGNIDDAGVPLDPARGRLYGVMTELSHRHLVGNGWTVAARTTVGGLGALLGRPAKEVTGQQLSLHAGLPEVDGDAGEGLVAAVCDVGSNAERVDLMRSALAQLVERRDPGLLAEAREVSQLAALAETDRSVRRVEQLASAGGVSLRTLQRLFDLHVGVSPSFVIRRWRIIEAAESAKAVMGTAEQWSGWSTVAAELGYADQAHLTRDFRKHLGVSPSRYLRNVKQPRPAS